MTAPPASPSPTEPLKGDPDGLLTIARSAAFCDLAEKTIRRAIDASELPTCRFGRAVRVRLADLKAWIRRHRQPHAKSSSK